LLKFGPLSFEYASSGGGLIGAGGNRALFCQAHGHVFTAKQNGPMLMDWEYQRESYADAESYRADLKGRKRQMQERTINEY